MAEGDRGNEQFARAITRFRNQSIMSALGPLFTLRSELVGNDDFKMRGGIDTTTRNHILNHLIYADKFRRHVTYNPENIGLKYIETAIDPKMELKELSRPFGGDEVQSAAGSEINLVWALDGSDPDIPLASQLNFRSNHAKMLLGAIDGAIVYWTRLESRHKTWHITVMDSLRIHGNYQRILSMLAAFSGDENLVDIAAGVLPSEEPRGTGDSPNMRTEGVTNAMNNSYVAGQQGGGEGSSSAQAAANQPGSNWLNGN
ncbi:MAG: hypothetical protein AAGJ46_12085 [Planctomycetota bacterium]